MIRNTAKSIVSVITAIGVGMLFDRAFDKIVDEDTPRHKRAVMRLGAFGAGSALASVAMRQNSAELDELFDIFDQIAAIRNASDDEDVLEDVE